jgi:hypothetical protein
MDKCPYCGYDISDLKEIDYVEVVINEEKARRNGNGLSKENKEALFRSETFMSHNWDLKDRSNLLSMYCRDCGKTPVELGFWERVDPYTLETINPSKGWMTTCPGKKANIIEFPKEEKSGRRQDNKSIRSHRK